jgi:uncharacterized membrane protein
LEHLEQEIRKEFQLDRLILFSDAVIAIAITLLVLEIKIPEAHGPISDRELLKELLLLYPKFFGFIFSFAMIGLYWMIHHRMFGFVTNYNTPLLRLNLLFLFFIALLPFSTGFYGNFTGAEMSEYQLKVPMAFYALNLGFVGLSNYLLWSYISNPKNKLTEKALNSNMVNQAKARSIVVPSIFLLMPLVALFTNVLVAVYIPLLIPLALRIIKRIYSKKIGIPKSP